MFALSFVAHFFNPIETPSKALFANGIVYKFFGKKLMYQRDVDFRRSTGSL